MKINLLFDSSYIIHRNLFSLVQEPNGKFLSKKEEQSLFIRRLIDDLNSIIAIFPRSSLNKIVWAQDSKSWRKDLIEKVSYKGTRVKDEEKVDWDSFYALCNEFSEILKECGFIVSKENRAEADDLLYLWSSHLLESGESSVIITSDRDLNQCVRFDGNNLVSIFNPVFKSKKFTFHSDLYGKTFGDTSAIDDIFSFGEESAAERLLKISLQYEQEFVDPFKVSFSKIFEGDKGDNVPSALQWKKTDKTGTEKTFSFTQKMTDELLKTHVPDKDLIEKMRTDKEFRDEISKAAILISRQDLPQEEISERIAENITLMYLDHTVIPCDITVSNLDEQKTTLDLRDDKIYEMKPEWTYKNNSDKGIDSDIFSFLS